MVVSKKNEELSAFSWDIDYVIQKQDWALLEYEEDEIKQLPNISLIENAKSGTYVLLQNFDKIATTTVNLNVTLNNKMSEMIDHLARANDPIVSVTPTLAINPTRLLCINTS